MQPIVRSPVLVGRSAELAEVRRLVAAAAAGHGGAVTVTGEAGIGKSRLLAAAVEAAEAAGLTVLTGRAIPGGGAYRAVAEAVFGHLDDPDVRGAPGIAPYLPALDRLRSGAEVSTGPGAADQAVVLGEGLRQLMRAAGPAGYLLRLEDLHWADADTVAVVDYLAGAVAADRAVVAVSARPGPVTARLADVPGLHRLALSRLDADGVAALAAACRDGRPLPEARARELHARSEGVPFLVEEMLADPDRLVPASLAALVESRLAGLDAPARQVLAAAAVLGPDPDWGLPGPVAGVAAAAVGPALRQAVDAALLVRDGPTLRWPHALIREAVRELLLPPERAVLAERAAEALGPTERAAQLLVDAGHRDRAAELYLRLARDHAGRGALHTAEQLLATVEAARPSRSTAEQVLGERVAVLTLVGRAEEALALGRGRLDAASGKAHAELCLQLARTAVAAGRWREAEEFVERAGRPDDPRSGVLLADAAFGAGWVDVAARLAGDAIGRAEAAGAWVPLCDALGVLARTCWRTDLPAATAAYRRAAQVAAEHGLTPWRVTALFGAGMIEALVADEQPTLYLARRLARDAGMLSSLASSDIIVSDVVLLADGPATAVRHARAALQTAERLRLPALADIARMQTALCCAAGGDRAGAQELIDAVPDPTPGNRALAAMARGVAALVEHDLEQALAELDPAVGLVLDDRATPLLAPVGAWMLLHTLLDRRPEQARSRLSAHPDGLSTPNRAALAYAGAVHAGRSRAPADARAQLAEGDRLLEGRSWWRRLLRVAVLERAVRDGWGEPVAALRADLAAHESSGDELLARTCRDLLRAAGAPTRRRAGPAVPPGLRAVGTTPREFEVLTLVARGLTNSEVADRLHLSSRTVDTHVASLLAKTGAAGRRDLARWLVPPPAR